MENGQANPFATNNMVQGGHESVESISRAKWVEPAFAPRAINNKSETTLFIYPTPHNRWNGMVFSGRLHVGDVVGGASITEVKAAVSYRQYVISTIKEVSDMSRLREEMARLGLCYA